MSVSRMRPICLWKHNLTQKGGRSTPLFLSRTQVKLGRRMNIKTTQDILKLQQALGEKLVQSFEFLHQDKKTHAPSTTRRK